MLKQYIGTKIILAESQDKDGQGGMKVIYKDDYESWSPVDIFADTYRRTDNMNFGLAIEAMKMGKRVARTGWNGKNMFIYLEGGYGIAPLDLRGPAATHVFPLVDCKETVEICQHIDMKSVDNSIVVGWLASQTDILSDDWFIVSR